MKGESLFGTCHASDEWDYKSSSKYSPEHPKSWETFLNIDLDLVVDGTYFSSLIFQTASQKYDTYAYKNSKILDVSFNEYFCNDSSIVSSIVTDLRTGNQKSYSCNDNIWRTFSCSKHTAICVNCLKGCTACPGDERVLTPCKTNCESMSASFSVVHFSVSSRLLFPSIKAMNVSSGNSSIFVSIRLSEPGRVTCGAFRSPWLLNLDVLKMYGVTSVISYDMLSLSHTALITIKFLSPLTLYDVYCHTESFSGHRMNNINTALTKKQIMTSCCKKILFSVASTLSIKPSPDLFSMGTISINSFPSISELIELSSASCSSEQRLTNQSLPYFVPSAIKFSLSSTEMSKTFRIYGSSSGCFTLKATGSSDYLPAYAQVTFTDSTIVARLVSALLSDDGRKVFATFSSDTDKGGATGAFPCHVCY
jgi:hypothetical protein